MKTLKFISNMIYYKTINMVKRKKRATTQKKDNYILVLIDHDGTLCNTSPSAYESLKFAAQMACESVQININDLQVDWNTIFHQTRGSTERNFIRLFCFRHSVPLNQMGNFEERFYLARAVWFKNMKSFKENPYDTYFPDAENLINICSHHPNTTVWLITGNPIQVINERLAKHLRNYFTDKKNNLLGSFGNEALTREELIQIAIQRAMKLLKGFVPLKDSLGFTTNVVYIGDARKDFFSGLNSRVKTVWIPSRSLQEVKDVLAEDYIIFLKQFLKHRIQIVNRIDSEEVLEMILSKKNKPAGS